MTEEDIRAGMSTCAKYNQFFSGDTLCHFGKLLFIMNVRLSAR